MTTKSNIVPRRRVTRALIHEPIPLADSMCEDFDDLERCITMHAKRLRLWVTATAADASWSVEPLRQWFLYHRNWSDG